MRVSVRFTQLATHTEPPTVSTATGGSFRGTTLTTRPVAGSIAAAERSGTARDRELPPSLRASAAKIPPATAATTMAITAAARLRLRLVRGGAADAASGAGAVSA